MENKKLKTILAYIILTIFAFNIFSACKPDDNGEDKTNDDPVNASYTRQEIDFSDQIFEDDTFDKLRYADDEDYFDNSVFYRNDLKINGADPNILYITEGSQAGYFYLYVTGAGATRGFTSRRSRDLVTWENMGQAFVADAEQSWATGTFWAPEVIYYKTPQEKEAGLPGKYYMFFSANHGRNNSEYGRANYSIGMAYSDNPQGPFVQFVGTNQDGREMGLSDVYIETIKFPQELEAYSKPLIDAHCFVDDDAEIYLYFSLDSQHGDPIECSIWGLRMKDMFTPDYPTLKQITKYNRKTVDSTVPFGEKDFNNEGPFIIKQNGRYILTFSHAFWFSPEYTVAQATADSPLGDFVKVDHDKGGQALTIIGNDGEDYYDFMAGTGHHSFFYVGDELFIVYHAFKSRSYNDPAGRHIAFDRVSFVHNGEEEILYVNGPSYSLQPLPEELSGYENIAHLATVTATNALSNDVSLLTNGQYKNHNFDFLKEFSVSCDTKIALTFPREYDVRAVMVYNAFNSAESFVQIDEILLETTADIFDDGSTVGYAEIKNLAFNADFYRFQDPKYDDIVNMRPGGSSVALFDEIPVKTIIITIKKSSWFMQTSSSLAISNITVLAKKQ